MAGRKSEAPSAKGPDGGRRCAFPLHRPVAAERALEREEALLGGEPARSAIAAEPALGQHAMARDDDRDRVLAAGTADGARRRTDRPREIAVAAGLAVGDGQ